MEQELPGAKSLAALQNADNFTLSIATGDRWTRTETRKPHRLRRSVTASERDAAHDGACSKILVSGQFVQRKRQVTDLPRISCREKPYSVFPRLIPKKNGAVESEADDRFPRVRENCLQK